MHDDTLKNFQDIEHEWSGILIGNGASRAISSTFAYASLYDKACSSDIDHPLASHEQSIFDAFKTKNFELVLSALSVAQVVNGCFLLDAKEIADSYEKIRIALIEAVRSVHILKPDIPSETLADLSKALVAYDFVYSTNYDLLVYWAMMQNPGEFRDYFFSGSRFDLSNTEVWSKSTKVLFLHGGLHLYRSPHGYTYKRSATLYQNLLDLFGTPHPEDQAAIPLFVTEGDSADKLRSIFNSDYLSFAYNQFTRHHGPLVVFGQALDEKFDGHLISALSKNLSRTLGIGIHPQSTGNVAKVKAQWQAKFHNFELCFFDSSTHPLGSPELQVK